MLQFLSRSPWHAALAAQDVVVEIMVMNITGVEIFVAEIIAAIIIVGEISQ